LQKSSLETMDLPKST